MDNYVTASQKILLVELPCPNNGTTWRTEMIMNIFQKRLSMEVLTKNKLYIVNHMRLRAMNTLITVEVIERHKKPEAEKSSTLQRETW